MESSPIYIQSLLHYIENAQENKKNTILSYNIAENSKRVKRNEEKVCVCVCMEFYLITIFKINNIGKLRLQKLQVGNYR
jgi:hypothetical protein